MRQTPATPTRLIAPEAASVNLSILGFLLSTNPLSAWLKRNYPETRSCNLGHVLMEKRDIKTNPFTVKLSHSILDLSARNNQFPGCLLAILDYNDVASISIVPGPRSKGCNKKCRRERFVVCALLSLLFIFCRRSHIT